MVLVSCSTRAATLTVSPIKVNSSLPPPPMVPAITTPVLIPIPIRSAPPNRLSDETVNQHGGAHRGVGMIREIIRGAEDRQGAVAEELVDMPTGVDDGRHDNFK